MYSPRDIINSVSEQIGINQLFRWNFRRHKCKFAAWKSKHLRLGRRGEKLASALLRTKNYIILCRNYKVKSGEIDIVARDGAVLVFIEVKTRSHTTRSRPAQGLTEKQKKRIVSAAMKYLKQIDSPEVVYRFDLIEMVLSPWKIYEARHWIGHFNPSGKDIM